MFVPTCRPNMNPSDLIDARSGSDSQENVLVRQGFWAETKTTLRMLRDICSFPRKVRRYSQDMSVSPSVPVIVDAREYAKAMNMFHLVEMFQAMIQLTLVFTLLFNILRLELSEIRERLSGWLIFAMIILAARCSLLSFIIEDCRSISNLGRMSEARIQVVQLLRGSRVPIMRVLHIATILWALVAWQPIFLYRTYVQAAQLSVDGRFPRDIRFRPQITGSHREKMLMTGFKEGLLLNYSFVFLDLISLFLTWVYFSYRRSVPSILWHTFFTNDNEYSISTQRPSQHSASILSSFPTLAWKSEWTNNTEEICCSVCLSAFTDGDTVRILSCAHIFHINCIDTWLMSSSQCPLRCNLDLTNRFCSEQLRQVDFTNRLPPKLAQVFSNLFNRNETELTTTTAN